MPNPFACVLYMFHLAHLKSSLHYIFFLASIFLSSRAIPRREPLSTNSSPATIFYFKDFPNRKPVKYLCIITDTTSTLFLSLSAQFLLHHTPLKLPVKDHLLPLSYFYLSFSIIWCILSTKCEKYYLHLTLLYLVPRYHSEKVLLFHLLDLPQFLTL